MVAWLAQLLGGVFQACAIVQFLNILFGSCGLFMFIAKDITQDAAGFNFAATETSDENRTELKKRFCDLVQIYSDTKE